MTSLRTLVSALALLSSVVAVLSVGAPADALPVYSVAGSRACDTCHIEPLGWANPDLSERRCTMDCLGCHVSPAGGGMRLADGIFYGQETLPMFGTRPSDSADPEKYRPRGFPKKGRYKLGEGFSGWWPGKVVHTTIDERYGDIAPNPKWRVGGDFRLGFLQQIDSDAQSESEEGSAAADAKSTFLFPMQADVYVLNESVKDLQLYVSGGLQGYKDGLDAYTSEDIGFADYFTLRELFLKLRLPYYNSWVRAGRLIPRYGWRLSDHTAFVRHDLGFNQYYQAFGVDAGVNPNYFFTDASFYFQGLEAWPGERMRRGLGGTFNVGWRDLGWSIAASAHVANIKPIYPEDKDIIVDTDGDGIGDTATVAEPIVPKANQMTVGLSWGLNLHPFVYHGELDLRRTTQEGQDTPNTVLAYHELNFEITRGLFTKLKYDYYDGDIAFANNVRHRVTLAADLYPYTYVHLEPMYRLNYANTNPLGNTFGTTVNEFFLITHLFF